VTLPAESGLRPGMFARAEILPAAAAALVVPQEAVVFRGGQAVAFCCRRGASAWWRAPCAPGSGATARWR
jgi:hypothetical protein